MNKTKHKEIILFPIGTDIKVKELNLLGRIKGFTVTKKLIEYSVEVNLGYKKQKMFFRENELESI